ncbi:Bug family tripartite tricarboxylate transporter substrate binding protein [Variovorax atrisoli]|uniref:Bug family tripartite tricarboxylate transporter substrate binding protein n=1 Tax=Variovorax atrisoli TaxID=3394203 RepID=UPI00339A1B99
MQAIMNSRRKGLRALVLTSLLGLSGLAAGQTERYPSAPVRLILPAAAGTGVDILGRIAAQYLGDVLGQPVIVENVVGASGVIGVQRVVRAKPDGYTLLFTFNQTITINPHVVANLPYDPEKDLVPISRFAESTFVWLINAQVPVTTFPELLRHAKANPSKLAMGVTGYGSAAYLGAQMLSLQTGAELLHVNYANNFSANLLSNEVQLSMSPASQVPGLLATGKVRALAQTGPRRTRGMLDLPTVSEFVPGHVIEAWYGVWAPQGTPKPTVLALSQAWMKVAAMPEVAARLEKLGAEPVGSSAEALADHARRETRTWAEVVKARGIRPSQ